MSEPGGQVGAGPGPAWTVGPNGRLVDLGASPSERQYATLMHLTLLLAFVMPILSVIAPLVMWLVKRESSAFIDDHGKETLNFHISVLIYGTVAALLIVAVVGVPLLIAVYVLGLVGMIKASTAANRGEYYRYPVCVRMVR